MSHFLAIDCETGGFTAKRNPLLSIACVLFDKKFEILEQRFAYILPDPQKEITPEAAAINGYSPEVWAEFGAVPLNVCLSGIAHWLSSFPPFVTLAHNANFDERFVYTAQKESGIRLPGVPLERGSWTCSQVAFKIWREQKGLPGSHSLDALCKIMNFPRAATHDALEDAIACGKGFGYLLDDLKGTSPNPPTIDHGALRCSFKKHLGKRYDIILSEDPQYLTWLCGQSWFRGAARLAVESLLSERQTPKLARGITNADREAFL